MTALTFVSGKAPFAKTVSLVVQTSESDYSGAQILPASIQTVLTTQTLSCNTLHEFYRLLTEYSAQQCALLRGILSKDVSNEHYLLYVQPLYTQWLVLDTSGVFTSLEQIDQFLEFCGLKQISYIVQYTSSHLIRPGIHARFYFWLQRPYSEQELISWLQYQQLKCPVTANLIKLSPSRQTLAWPFSLQSNSNRRLLLISPPIFRLMTDPVPTRWELCERQYNSVLLNQIDQSDLNTVIQKTFLRLRAQAKLPKIQLRSTLHKKLQVPIVKTPEQFSVTQEYVERQAVRLNLLHSTQWEYYYFVDQPELLYSLNDDPIFLLSEVLPFQYQQAVSRARTRQYVTSTVTTEDTIQRFVINRRDEGKYYKVTYFPQYRVQLDPAPSIRHIKDFCALHNIPEPEVIEDWDVVFDPTSSKLVDFDRKVINTRVFTPYFFADQSFLEVPPNYGIPELYWNLFYHVCGSDYYATKHFINWLAYIWQTGQKPKTAWVFHGTYGTGKGRLLRVLMQLFGDHCLVVSPENITDHFNAPIERAQILWIDEVTTDAWDNAKITPKLRNWITEDYVTIRGMRREFRVVPSYMGIIIAANEHNPVEIRYGDRRYNVCPRQERRLDSLSWATAEVLDNDRGILYQPESLMSLAAALRQYPVNEAQVATPLDTEAKALVMQVTQSLPEDIILALQQGRVSFFLQYLNADISSSSLTLAFEYKQILEKMIRGGRVALSTREIMLLFEYLAGWNQPPGKFHKAISKYGLMLSGKTAREGSRVFAGTYFTFRPTSEDVALWQQLTAQSPKLTVVSNNK